MNRVSIQDHHFPDGECFGCGSKNESGLQIKSFPRPDGSIVAVWPPRAEHSNGVGSVCGGVLATVLDCHCAAAALQIIPSDSMLTKQFTIEFLKPTPMAPLELVARVVERRRRSVEIEASAIAEGVTCATLRGIFVAPKGAA